MSRPNMSYCRYQNTCLAMEQILNDISDRHSDEFSPEKEMSEDETRAKKRLARLCQDFLEEFENN